MKISHFIYSIFITFLVLFNTSCNDFLTQEPETSVTNTNFWKTEQDCEAALNGLQVQFRNCFKDLNTIDRDRAMPFDYLDEFWETACNNTPIWGPNDPQLSWSLEYKVIANTNLLIDNLSRANISEERYNHYLGQAYAIRAYTYFSIIRTWGDAPLVLNSKEVEESGRIPALKIGQQIVKDFTTAYSLLPHVSELKYADNSKIASKQYFGKETVQAALAHVYAWLDGVYNEPNALSKGIEMADAVINSNEYQLVADPEAVCKTVILGNSTEGILEIDFQERYSEIHQDGICYQSFFQAWPLDKLSTIASPRYWLRISFPEVNRLYPYKQDKRRKAYFYKLDSTSLLSPSITQNSAYIIKYRGAVTYIGGTQDGRIKGYEDNIIHIRLADIILLRAELRAKAGDFAGAANDLNIIRQRAGIPDYDASKDGDIRKAIATERDRELFAEGFCTRYFDNVRNGTFRENLRGEFKTLTEQDVANGALFIPVCEYAFYNNPQMRQTVYWQNRGY